MTDDLWGVADLHAHPAAHLAFGGLDGHGLIWGDPGLPGGVYTAVPGGDLPDIPPCDPETHDPNVTDQVSRTTRGLVFSLLANQSYYPHSAHGGSANDGETAYQAWPNARDILHQMMNVQGVRRAYDGGLRLIFASALDSQAIGLAMHTTILPPTFMPSRQAERASAEAQLQFIRNLVSQNADWMEIAATPEQAADAIRSNRLAVVLALEMDGLTLDDVKDLVSTYGVASIVPIHLVDNDVGGTAAYNDIFNGGTALLGSMFGYPDRFISVQGDSRYDFRFGWPPRLHLDLVAYKVDPVPYSTAATLGYTPYPLCSPPATGVGEQYGLVNSVGLREPQTIRELMSMGLIIDLAHMGFRSTRETIDLAGSTCSYPLVDTHTGVHFRDQPRMGSERDLYEDHADYVASHQGVLGLGSTGRQTDKYCSRLSGGLETKASARGGPLTSLSDRHKQRIIQFPGGGPACSNALGESMKLGILVKLANGASVPDGATSYVQIGYASGYQDTESIYFNQQKDFLLSDQGSTDPSQPPNVTSITVGLLNPTSCQEDSSQGVDVASVEISDSNGDPLMSLGQAQLGMDDSGRQTLASLSHNRQTFTVYSQCPMPDSGKCEPANNSKYPTEPVRHLRIRAKSGAQGLASGSPITLGARVAGALCTDSKCSNVVPDACAAGLPLGFTLTPAGAWPNNLELDAFVTYPSTDAGPPAFPAMAICIDQRDLATETLEIDEVDVDVVEDPVRTWTADYTDLLTRVFGGRVGAIALGTDDNGLAEQMPYSDYSPPYAEDPGNCRTSAPGAAGAGVYGDPNSGGTYTLQRPLRIGNTALCFSERGLANYGMLPEFFASVYHYDPAVYRSLFRSAAATIDAWSATRAAALQYATSPSTCGSDASAPSDANAPADSGLGDASPDGGFEGGVTPEAGNDP
jgi:microsomal dipeptidase-like Zn-dependent dipeptidase